MGFDSKGGKMNPLEFWYQFWVWWTMTVFQPDEIRALRNCQNANKIRLDRTDKALRELQ